MRKLKSLICILGVVIMMSSINGCFFGGKDPDELRGDMLKFVNEKYDVNIMDEKIKGYAEQISDALTDEALDYLIEHGNGNLISDEELGKLFSKRFVHKVDCPSGRGLCLVYDENNSEIELFSLNAQMIVWSVKCDINNVQSIINSAIECLNNSMKEGDLDPYIHN